MTKKISTIIDNDLQQCRAGSYIMPTFPTFGGHTLAAVALEGQGNNATKGFGKTMSLSLHGISLSAGFGYVLAY